MGDQSAYVKNQAVFNSILDTSWKRVLAVRQSSEGMGQRWS